MGVKGTQANARWRAALYIRLSREDGHDESYSVTNQRTRLLAALEGLQGQEDICLAGVYVDDGYSGTDSERAGLQRMLEDVTQRTINCVMVKDLSRLSRNYVESGHYLEYFFVRMDVRFISLELPALDSFRYPEQMNSMAVPMQSVFNDNHCRETSLKVRSSFHMKRTRGEFIGAFAPYGYSKDASCRHAFLPDPDAADVVRDIFHWFVYDGMSKSAIVRRLTAQGVPCPSAQKRAQGLKYHNPAMKGGMPRWSVRTVGHILSNRVYAGDMVQGRQRVKSYKVHTRVAVPDRDWYIVKNTHEALIDAALFARAQTLLAVRTRTPPGGGGLYLFSGFLRCADCGCAMGRRTAKGLVYYACRTYTETGACSRHSIRHERLEAATLHALQGCVEALPDRETLQEEIRRAPVVMSGAQRLRQGMEVKTAQLEQLKKAKTALYMDWKNEDITRDEYHTMKADFARRMQLCAHELDALGEEYTRCQGNEGQLPPGVAAFVSKGNVEALDRGVLSAVVGSIIVHEGGALTVVLRCRGPDGMLS